MTILEQLIEEAVTEYSNFAGIKALEVGNWHTQSSKEWLASKLEETWNAAISAVLESLPQNGSLAVVKIGVTDVRMNQAGVGGWNACRNEIRAALLALKQTL